MLTKNKNTKFNKKILITGQNGFIGSNCTKFFAQKGYDIFGIDIFGENCSNFIKGEVNLNNLKSFNQNFDVIIHLAGSGTVGLAQKSPELEHLKTVGSTEHILEYMRLYNKEAKLIYSSSAAVYGDLYDRPISENDILNPISIYGQHKVEVEKMCKNYHNHFGLNINIIRFFSIYGEGLKKQLLWDFCNRVVKNSDAKSLPCFGTGKEKRDFIHIKDVIQLIEILIERDNKFTIMNCGTGKEICVYDVLNSICKELNFSGDLNFDNLVKEGDPKALIANVDEAKTIGFEPNIKAEEGIKYYVEWFKNQM